LAWQQAGLFHNLGLVCGPASGNLVVLDLDGWTAYQRFCQSFPSLAQTYTVLTGSGVGAHLYWRVSHLPPTRRALTRAWGNFELCALGRQVVAPPSVHPRTGNRYTVWRHVPIQEIDTLDSLLDWLAVMAPRQRPQPVPLRHTNPLNPRVIDTLTATFLARAYKQRGDWLNGRCLYPERHRHQDAHPSFGFNLRSGYGYCFVCGALLAKDLCAVLNIDLASLGGLFAA
jgi:hypothetical protein